MSPATTNVQTLAPPQSLLAFDRPGVPPVPATDAAMAVLINSSCGYDDCWLPFFRLLEICWPDCPFPLYLNSEEGTYEHGPFRIHCLTHKGQHGRRMPWSDQLRTALVAIPQRYVLYLQEDYFLDAPVDQPRIAECLAVVAGAGLGCIHLTPFGAHGGTRRAELPYLVDVPRVSPYRFSTQAAIWDKHVLASYLGSDESAWETEMLGTLRSWSRPAPVRSVTHAAHGVRPIVSYTGTGIIRGRWHPAVLPLFARHGIDIDFSKRGIHGGSPRWATRLAMLRRLARRPLRPLAALMGW